MSREDHSPAYIVLLRTAQRVQRQRSEWIFSCRAEGQQEQGSFLQLINQLPVCKDFIRRRIRPAQPALAQRQKAERQSARPLAPLCRFRCSTGLFSAGGRTSDRVSAQEAMRMSFGCSCFAPAQQCNTASDSRIQCQTCRAGNRTMSLVWPGTEDLQDFFSIVPGSLWEAGIGSLQCRVPEKYALPLDGSCICMARDPRLR